MEGIKRQKDSTIPERLKIFFDTCWDEDEYESVYPNSLKFIDEDGVLNQTTTTEGHLANLEHWKGAFAMMVDSE